MIPAKRNSFLMLFLTAWLVGWCFGEVFAIRELFFGRSDALKLFERQRAALETFDSLATNGHKYFPTMPYKEKSRPKTTFS